MTRNIEMLLMPTTRKPAARKRMPRRDLYAELTEGVAALADDRGGKRQLRARTATSHPTPGSGRTRKGKKERVRAALRRALGAHDASLRKLAR